MKNLKPTKIMTKEALFPKMFLFLNFSKGKGVENEKVDTGCKIGCIGFLLDFKPNYTHTTTASDLNSRCNNCVCSQSYPNLSITIPFSQQD